MQVYMHNLLSSLLSDIELELVSRDIHISSEIASQEKESSYEGLIIIVHIWDSRDMALWNQEHMNASLRMDIVEH